MEYVYLGTTNGNSCSVYCSVLKSEYSFEELNKKAEEGTLDECSFTSCSGTNWGGTDNLSRTLGLIPFQRTGRVIRVPEKIRFHGSDQDMWHVREWTVSYDTFCEMAPESAATADNAAPKSQYRGAVGQHWIIQVEAITPVTTWGEHTLYVITDKQGNVFTCKCRRILGMASAFQDKKMFIDAVVKRHVEYRGVKQTWVEDPQVFYT